MIILNLIGYIPENLTISKFFNVTLGTLRNNYTKDNVEYLELKKAIEIERANRIEKFKGEGLVLEEAFKSIENQHRFFYYRILSVYKELLDESKYTINKKDSYFEPLSFIINELSSNIKDVTYNGLQLTDFFGGINENSFEEYFLNLFNFLKAKIKKNTRIRNATTPLICLKPFQYHSDFLTSMDTEPFRIQYVEGYESMLEKFHDEIELLKIFGEMLDNYFYNRSDANKFIFILKNLPYKSSSDNYSSFLASISILELFKKNGFSWTDMEKEEITRYFCSPYWTATKEEVNMIIKIRNKLIHADYVHYFKLLDQYKKLYMIDFEFDTFEATDYRWILDIITMKVNEAVANIILQELSNNGH